MSDTHRREFLSHLAQCDRSVQQPEQLQRQQKKYGGEIANQMERYGLSGECLVPPKAFRMHKVRSLETLSI